MGVLESVAERGARDVETARFLCDGASADFELGRASGVAISRFALDPILFQATTAEGARGFLGARTRDLRAKSATCGGGFEFEGGGQTWRTRAVILAAGRSASPKSPELKIAGSKPSSQPQKMKAQDNLESKTRGGARFCGLKAHFSGVDLEVGTVEMHLFRGGYCGLVRVEGEATNACLMIDYARLGKMAPALFWEKILAENRALRARFAGATRISQWCTTGNVSFDKFRPRGEVTEKMEPMVNSQSEPQKASAGSGTERGILCAGDAAGYIHPLTGDGMAMALRAGELAATCARLQVCGLEAGEAAQLYEAAWEREFAPRLRLAAQLHPLALRPEWARPILPVLAHFPALRHALVRGTRGANRI